MAEKKITKRDRFAEVRAIVAEMGRDDLVAFVDHELELLDRKNANKANGKPTKAQLENLAIKERIIPLITDKAMTVGEIVKEFDYEFTAPKITAILTKARKDGEVERTEVKGKPYYKAV